MQTTIFWFRRDLRLHDNKGLFKALTEAGNVQPLFIFDKDILDKLSDTADKRVSFLHDTISNLKQELEKMGSTLLVKYGKPFEVWQSLIDELDITAVYLNRDYEPYAQNRDKAIFDLLAERDIKCYGSKDHVIFEKSEVVKDDGKPYTVFTPYSKKWKKLLSEADLKDYPSEEHLHKLNIMDASAMPSLEDMGFTYTSYEAGALTPREEVVTNYHLDRDLPSKKGTTRVSVSLRFGLSSIRQFAKKGSALNEKWLNELIWRDFYQMIIYHFPHSVKNSFKPAYDAIEWENDEVTFRAWCEGRTGYPIVDAGMRELNTTGFMHNRVRMIVASFLTKHLLIDWRWGEAYFAEKLMDFELASNVGGWQWAASSGCDAAPYFRVFNPYLQQDKFDKDYEYVKKWVPEFQSSQYPAPIIEHKYARERVLKRFKDALG
ncbi:MAG: DNA photolyase family protein [Schleiferiaceae bacterium]|nr:DNA photolyase family protein [Schleiferiaceae bacterium]